MRRITARLGNLRLLLASLPLLVLHGRRRALWREMRSYVRALPAELRRPLPEAMARWEGTPWGNDDRQEEATIRHLADLAALWERRSPVGLCLRRSLVRYYFLRRAGFPVTIHYGARLVGPPPERAIKGHAWLTRDGLPYFEQGENWQGFTTMITFPAGDQA
jgi:hypothetical protein